MTLAATASLGDIFKAEISEAKRLGYTPQINNAQIAVIMRLVPATQKTKRIAADANPGAPAPAIEAAVPITDERDRLAAISAAFTATLQLARDANA